MSSFDVGLDIIEVDRVRALARRSPRFLRRVFTPSEIEYCQSFRKPWEHFAVRFAAKEAVWKALGRDGIVLTDISIGRGRSGKPEPRLKGKPLKGVALSLSHTERYAAAVAFKTGR